MKTEKKVFNKKRKIKAKQKQKRKQKRKWKSKIKTNTKMRIKMKSFCVFLSSMWPRGVIDGQVSLTWPRSAMAFSFVNFALSLAVS